jgi:HD-GYP domain-containing protein (c-di-GMP phosphodiesterase class II)
VTDAFETMIADRVYRTALPREDALVELERHAGAQFDPMVPSASLAAVDAGAERSVPASSGPAGMLERLPTRR